MTMSDERLASVIATCLEPLAQARDVHLVPGSDFDHAYDRTHLLLMQLFDAMRRDGTTHTG
jgi:hypothetical protein